MTGTDRAVGLTLLSIAVFVFGYYTLWTLVLPFVPPGNNMLSYFPPRQYAILIPIALLITALAFVVTFISYTIIKSRKKKTKGD